MRLEKPRPEQDQSTNAYRGAADAAGGMPPHSCSDAQPAPHVRSVCLNLGGHQAASPLPLSTSVSSPRVRANALRRSWTFWVTIAGVPG